MSLILERDYNLVNVGCNLLFVYFLIFKFLSPAYYCSLQYRKITLLLVTTCFGRTTHLATSVLCFSAKRTLFSWGNLAAFNFLTSVRIFDTFLTTKGNWHIILYRNILFYLYFFFPPTVSSPGAVGTCIFLPVSVLYMW